MYLSTLQFFLCEYPFSFDICHSESLLRNDCNAIKIDYELVVVNISHSLKYDSSEVQTCPVAMAAIFNAPIPSAGVVTP